ncbi:MAG: hypothetical protein WCP77_16395, partial [Roseococcus sp.]
MRPRLLVLLLLAMPAAAQNAPSSLLGPPSLPSTLPGGGALQALPPSAQQDILQRLMDAGAGRPLGSQNPTAPQPAPFSSLSLPPPAPPALEEPLSPIEQFFDNRRPQPSLQAPANPAARMP